MTFTWRPPADDGNSPLTHYRLEMRALEADWLCVDSHIPPASKRYVVSGGLSAGQSYEFRLFAENRCGCSSALLSERVTLQRSADTLQVPNECALIHARVVLEHTLTNHCRATVASGHCA